MGKVFGGVLLIVGNCIGSGMLALPVVTAAGGFFHSAILLVLAWAVMTVGAFYLLEVNLWLPPNTNMISMARLTLGRLGEIATWFCYCMLLYSLLSAYTAGGADLLRQLLLMVRIDIPDWLDTLFFVIVLSAVVYHGVSVVDWANRFLMLLKLLAYAIVVVLVMPHYQWVNVTGGQFKYLGGAVLVAITSFGYAGIIPPLRNYFHSNVKQLKLSIAIGSVLSLICYLLWNFTVQGNIPAAGKHGLVAISHSATVVSDLTMTLSDRINSLAVHQWVHIFTSVCLTTAFLGVGLSLADFVRDGFSIKRDRAGHWKVMLITFAPPAIIVLFFPGLFIAALRYAGIFCVTLLALLPALMTWYGRYRKHCDKGFRVFGGRTLVIVEVIVIVIMLIYGILYL